NDILRTAVLWEGLGEPVQVVLRKADLAVEEVELDSAKEDVAKSLYERFNARNFRIDVRHAPLVRAYIAPDPANGRWLMGQLIHHLAGDRSTLEGMQGEIQAHLAGQGESLPSPLPFRELVAHAKFGVAREAHEAYFRQLLGDVEEPTAPFGLLGVMGDGNRIEDARLKLDIEL